MSLLARAVTGRKALDQEAQAETFQRGHYTVPTEWLARWSPYGLDGYTAYNITAVYQCVRVLAETFASVPLIVYRRLPGGGKERAEDHPLYDVLHRRPNPQMTSFIWREIMMSHLATWGNHYSEMALDFVGRLQLWPIRPDRVEPFYYSEQLVRESPYNVSVGDRGYWYVNGYGQKTELAPGRIFHVQGLSSNGLVGLSPIAVMRNTIRLLSSAERFGTSFFDNDARPGTYLSHPKNLSLPAIERLKAQMEGMKGADNAGSTVILEEGLTVSEVGLHPEDAQFMETRLFQKREIAAAYRIQPHKIGDLERATFSNIEQQNIEFITDTMVPWFVRAEQDMAAQLLGERDQQEYFIEFLADGYLRGDAKTRAESLAIRWQHGNLNADEWRAIENENPLPNGTGEKYFVPVNYQPTELAVAPPPPVPAPQAQPPELTVIPGAVKMAQFDCDVCGKLINRLAAPGTVGICRNCREERTMALAMAGG